MCQLITPRTSLVPVQTPGPAPQICVSSFYRGHANVLCIYQILVCAAVTRCWFTSPAISLLPDTKLLTMISCSTLPLKRLAKYTTTLIKSLCYRIILCDCGSVSFLMTTRDSALVVYNHSASQTVWEINTNEVTWWRDLSVGDMSHCSSAVHLFRFLPKFVPQICDNAFGIALFWTVVTTCLFSRLLTLCKYKA